VSAEERNRYFDRLTNRPGLRWMGQNTNHIALPPAVTEAMSASIASEDIRMYAPPLGIEALRAAIVAEFGVPNLAALLTDGGVEGLYHLCHTFLRAGDRLITTDPGWKWPPLFAQAVGAEVVEIPIYDASCGYRLTAQALEAVMDEHVRAIYLVDPNNPLGTCVGDDDMQRIAGIAREYGAILIHDCTYKHFAPDHVPAARYYPEGTATIYSFSKWLGLAGMRLGAVVAAPAIIERLASAAPNSLGSNIVTQRGALAGLRVAESWFPHVQAVQRRNQAAIKATADAIPGLHVPVFPSQGNFIVVECCAAGVRPEALVAALQRHGIVIRQGSYHTPRFGDRFVKISTTVPESWADELCERLPDAIVEARADPARDALY
jgi:aspartate/methionine/tyrosine aminotransferase